MGEALALGSALCWALALILFRRCADIPVLGVSLFKNTLAGLLIGLTMLVTGTHWDTQRSLAGWLGLISSGIIGLAVADALFLAAIKRIGASVTAVVESVYTPAVVGLSILVLGERPSASFYVGCAAVVFGVALATRGPSGAARADPLGVAMAVGAMLLWAVGVVLAKPELDRGALPEVTLVRLLSGILALVGWMAIDPTRRAAFSVLRPDARWRRLAPAAFLGTYVGILLWLGGLKYTSVSVAATLNQLAGVFTLILARVFLAEALGAARVLGTLLATSGAMIVLLGR